MQNTQNNSK